MKSFLMQILICLAGFISCEGQTVQPVLLDNNPEEVTEHCINPECHLLYQNAKKIFSVAGTSSRVYLAQVPVDISVPEKGIFISQPILKIILSDTQVNAYSDFIVQFLIAHELAHQIQFARYKNNISNISSCEMRRLYECQADILAGGMISSLYDLADSVALGSRFTPIMVHALEYVYDIGDEENSITSHPSSIERRSAFRLGLVYPIINGKNMSNNQQIREAVDYKNGDNQMDWSMRLARHITHYPNSVNKNIIYTSPQYDSPDSSQKMKWDTSPNHPYVQFGTGYFRNANSKPVKIFLQCKLAGMLRDSIYQDPKKPYIQGLTKNYEAVLAPGDSMHITGEMKWWGLATGTRMPTFLSPPDNEALYDAQLVEIAPESPDRNCPSGDFASKTNPANKSKLAFDLITADRYAENNFEELKVGFAQKTYPTDDQMYYSTNFGNRYGFETTITVYVTEKPELWMEIESKDSNEIRKAFDIGVETLRYLGSSGNIKITDDYYKHYEEGLDTTNEVPSFRGRTYHIINDTILVTVSKDNVTKVMAGVFKNTGNEVSVNYWANTFKKKTTYTVDIIIKSPKQKKHRQ